MSEARQIAGRLSPEHMQLFLTYRAPAALAVLLALPAIGTAQDSTAVRDSAQRSDTTRVAPAIVRAPALAFSGWVFGNYQYHTDQPSKDENRFDVERVYLTFDMPAGERASVRVTSDIYQSADGSHALRAKYAYLQYDYLRNSTFLGGLSANARIGLLHTVFITYEEQFWPRFFASTPAERFGYFSSSDFGVSTLVTLPARLGEVYAGITNGPTYRSSEVDRFKDFATRLTLTPFTSRGPSILSSLNLTGWIYRGATASKFVNATAPNVPIDRALNRSRIGAFAAVGAHRLTAAVEIDENDDQQESDSSSATSPYRVNDVTGRLFSTFVVTHPIDFIRPNQRSRLGFVGRFDRYTPDRDADGYARFLIGGVTWALTTTADVALDYQEQIGREGLSQLPSKVWFAHFSVKF